MIVKRIILVSVGLLFLRGSNIHALGSGALSNQSGTSAKVTGHGYSFVGVADDPSAVFFNPAGLVNVKGFNIQYGGAYLDINTEHTAKATGVKDKMDSNVPIVPYFYASFSRTESPWAFGLGINSPYGLVTEWKDTSFSKYYATESKLLMYMINPTVSYAFDDKVSLGVGVDYFNIYDTELNQKVNFNPGVETDGNGKITGDGDAWGYNAGLLFKANEKHSFGVSYRSQVKVPIEGETELTNLGPTAAFLFGGTSFKSDTKTEFSFPQTWTFGYGFKPTDRWTIFADYEWADWTVVKQTNFQYKNDNANLTHTINRDWQSSNNVAIGTEYKPNEKLSLRGGVLAYERVIPSKTLEASLPDSGRVALTTGAGYKWGNTNLDFSYVADFFNDRSFDNNAGNALSSQDGKFETMINIVSIGLSHRWGGN
ncbi:MAG: OmpP1/FadL family transporter [Elusimicrobiota bacterium]